MTDYPATHVVHCPNGPVDACEDHAKQIIGVFKHIDCHVVATKAAAGAECTNCKHAAEK